MRMAAAAQGEGDFVTRAQARLVGSARVPRANWFVSSAGITMVVHDVLLDDKTVSPQGTVRTIAMATKTAARSEFARVFGGAWVEGRRDEPAVNVTWWDCFAYCTDLTNREGLEPCYEHFLSPDLREAVVDGLRVDRPTGLPIIDAATSLIGVAERHRSKTLRQRRWTQLAEEHPSVRWSPVEDYLAQTGYRLPSVREWLAVAERAIPSALLGLRLEPEFDRYVQSAANAKRTLQPIAELKPDVLGCFDLLGNAAEICHPKGGGSHERSRFQKVVRDGDRIYRWAACGLSHDSLPAEFGPEESQRVRGYGGRRALVPVFGLRVARTIPR